MEAELDSGNSIGAKTTFPRYTGPCISNDGIAEPAGTAPDLKHWQAFITLFNSSLCSGWSDIADRSQRTENIYKCLERELSCSHSRRTRPETIDNKYS